MDNFEFENRDSENINMEPNGEPVSREEYADSFDPAEMQPQSRFDPPLRQPESQTFAYRGTGRKESPYANSPYVMNRPAENRDYQDGRYYQRQPAARPQSVREKPAAKKKSSGVGRKILAAVAILALVIASCGVTALLVENRWEANMLSMEQRLEQKIQGLEEQLAHQAPVYTGNSVSGTAPSLEGYSAGQVYAQNVQSVVLIESTIVSSMYGQTATGVSAGSGFILTEDGYVVTNYHVVEGASSVAVALYDGTRYPAAVVGYDSTNDVAVLKMEAAGLNPVTLGSSTDLIVGDQVIAIGNPLGELTSTLTVGYVSAKERDVSTDGTIINMIQTDAAINSGNSGGPLFNMKGEVVGITTAKYSGSSSSGASIEGIGFAIPIDDVLDGISQLMEHGYIRSAYLGVEVRNLDPSVAEIYGLPVGAYVAKVVEGGSAHRAGMQAKDIITQVGSTAIESMTDLTRALREYEPGDAAEVKVYRGGMELTLKVILDERPQDLDVVVTEPEGNGQMPEGSYDNWFDFFSPFFGNGG